MNIRQEGIPNISKKSAYYVMMCAYCHDRYAFKQILKHSSRRTTTLMVVEHKNKALDVKLRKDDRLRIPS